MNTKTESFSSFGMMLCVVALVAGCDTLSRYRATGPAESYVQDHQIFKQDLSLKADKTHISVETQRFNFTFTVALEIRNDGTSPLTFNPFLAELSSLKSEEKIPIVVIYLSEGEGKYRKLSKEDPSLEIGESKTVKVVYSFDGSPILPFTHIKKSEKQKNLRLRINGLTRKSMPIELKLDFTEI